MHEGFPMSAHALYRVAIWLPMVVPAGVIVLFETLDLSLSAGIVPEVMVYSLVYGGVPYTLLAVWATWWIGGQPEPAVRRLMFRAPLLMVACFVVLALLTGIAVGRPGPFVAVAVLGAAVTIPLGYAYVGLALLLRRCLGPRLP
jgi:hypothetical protein